MGSGALALLIRRRWSSVRSLPKLRWLMRWLTFVAAAFRLWFFDRACKDGGGLGVVPGERASGCVCVSETGREERHTSM